MIELVSGSPAETMALGRRLAGLLRAGDVVLLAGRLGAGKTVLVQGIAEGLGVSGPVTSPTFVIARRHDDGFLPLVHADAYRIGTMAEFDDLDLIDEDAVLVVEWGEAVAAGVPEDHLVVRLEPIGDTERRVVLEPHGTWSERDLEGLR